MSKTVVKRNPYQTMRKSGKKPIIVWLTEKRYKKLAERAEALGVQPAGLVRILIHSLLEDTAGGEE